MLIFGNQGRNKQIYFHVLSKISKTRNNINTSGSNPTAHFSVHMVHVYIPTQTEYGKFHGMIVEYKGKMDQNGIP